ncbi:c(7)-type cytochrome triheme domain-containing protein [Thiolapillus sp.]
MRKIPPQAGRRTEPSGAAHRLHAGPAVFLATVFLAGCTAAINDHSSPSPARETTARTGMAAPESAVKANGNLCQQLTGEACDPAQESMLGQFLKDIDVYGYLKRNEDIDGDAPAFEALPKDRFGLVNWTKAEMEGLISPRDSIRGEQRGGTEKEFFTNKMRLNVKVGFFPDVLFPHGTHSSMISCDSCHPEPFKKKLGANNIRMAEIFEGKWCGKCHGTVAFPVTYPVQEPFNCRRCHSLRKEAEH